MSIADSCGRTRVWLRTVAPGLAVWARLPGLYGWAAVSAGIALAGQLPWDCVAALGRIGRAPIGATAAILAAVFVVARSRALRCTALMLAGGLALLAGRTDQMNVFGAWCSQWSADTPAVLAGRVVTVPLATESGGVRYTVRCDSLFTSGGLRMLAGKLVQCHDQSPPDYGQAVLLRGTFQPPSLPSVAGAYDEYRYLLANGIWGTLRVEGRLQRQGPRPWAMPLAYAARQTVYAALARVADPGHRALLQAALLGERAVPRELKRSFDRAGISHLLAISGLHVGILIGALLAALALVPLSRREKYPMALAVLWGYVLLVGPVPSLVRAAIMATLLLGAGWLQRPSDALNALGVAGIVWLLLSPESLGTPGYQLSFAATLGIILALRALAPLVTPWRQNAAPPVRWLADAALVSTAAFCATAPVMAHHFGSVSLYGLAANLVVVLLMTVCMWFSFAGILLQSVAPAAGGVAMAGAELFLEGIVHVAEASTIVPSLQLAPFPWPFLVACAAMFAGSAAVAEHHRLRFAAVTLAVAAAVLGVSVAGKRLTAPVEILRVWDRSGGLAVAAFPDGRAWVCQTAERSPEPYAGRLVNGWLRRQGAAIDAVFAPATQAPGALDSLLAQVPCRGRLSRRPADDTARACGPAGQRCGVSLAFVFHPPAVAAQPGDRQTRALHLSVSRWTGRVKARQKPYAGHVLAAK